LRRVDPPLICAGGTGLEMREELLIAVNGSSSQALTPVSLEGLGLLEREHLQQWILDNPDVLGAGTQIITSEYDQFEAPDGRAVRDRLDVLGIDASGRLVVAELKRGAAPSTAHRQALNYAALVSRFSLADVAHLLLEGRSTLLEELGAPSSVDEVVQALETQRGMTADQIRSPRIVLIASDFPPGVTTTTVWLREQGVDVVLVRLSAYKTADEGIVVTFSQIYPVPEVGEFTVVRRSGSTASGDPAVEELPWTREHLGVLASKANPGTLALLDLVAASPSGEPVTFPELCEFAGMSPAQARGQLAGFTMLLRAKEFDGLHRWPVDIRWQSTGVAHYYLNAELARAWREIRERSPN
jgi:hypothetical protein